MRILQLRIAGFRGIRTATVTFDGNAVLIGRNNCGKSTLIDALALVLGRENMVRNLTEHDFSGSAPAPSDRFTIIVTLGGFPGNDPRNHASWFREGRAVPKWWNSSTNRVKVTPDCGATALCAQIALSARFDAETLSVETLRYFHDDDSMDDPFLDECVSPVPATLVKDIGFFLLPSIRTWDRMASFGSAIFRRLVFDLAGLPADQILLERDRLRNPESALEEMGQVKEIADRINSELAGILPDPPKFQLRLTQTDCDSFLNALVAHYHVPGRASLPAHRHGTGLLALQSIVLLLEFGRRRRETGKNFILAIEEPELHLAPGIQGRIMARCMSVTDQVLFTTHSPTLAAFLQPTQILALENTAGALDANPLLKVRLEQTATNAIRKLFTENRGRTVDALMHPAVLVPEGRIDYEFLRLLAAAVLNAEVTQPSGDDSEPPFSATVGVVATHDASVEVTFSALRKVRQEIGILVDGDTDGDRYVTDVLALATPPSFVLQWPPAWAIEDVVAWVLSTEEDSVVEMANERLSRSFCSTTEVRDALKCLTRPGGLKENYLAYEEVVGTIGCHPQCLGRARSVLRAIRMTASGDHQGNPELELDTTRTTAKSTVLRWNPPA